MQRQKGHILTNLKAMFTELNEGRDVAPGQLLRLEGYMQAMIHAGTFSKPELEALIATCYKEVFGKEAQEPFPPVPGDRVVIPSHMQRIRSPA